MRPITTSELDDIIARTDISRFISEVNYKFVFDRRQFVAIWGALINSGAGRIFARFNGNAISEAIGVTIYTDPHDGIKTGSIVFWFKDGRSHGLATGSLRVDVEKELKALGVQRLFVSAILNHRYMQVAQSLGREGFEPMEVHLMKKLWDTT